MLNKIKSLFFLNSKSIVFIAVNIFVALFGFVRSFAFMKFFGFEELGVITLVNTSAALIGFFQIGLINGGYRIIALRNSEHENKINNVIFSYFSSLLGILTIISVIIYFSGIFSDLLILSVIIVMGFCMLITNWLTNTLISAQEYKKLNKANAISAFASLVCLTLAYFFGLSGALLSLMIQPCLFVIIIFITYKKTLPNKFDLDFYYIKHILSFGFIPFLSGIFTIVYSQIERWSIVSFLGKEDLGKLYLFFIINTLWVLVPASVLNLFFPKTIRLYSDKDFINFHKVIKKNSIFTISYCLIIAVLIFFFLSSIVNAIFPKHEPYIYLIFIGLPGLIFRTFCDPISLYLNSIVKLKPLFWSDVFSIVSYASCVFMLIIFNEFSLVNIVICFDIYFFLRFCFLFIVYIKSIKKSYA